MKIEVDVLGSPSLIVRTVSVDIKNIEHITLSELRSCVKIGPGEHSGLPVPNSLYSLCGRKATFDEYKDSLMLTCGESDLISLCLDLQRRSEWERRLG